MATATRERILETGCELFTQFGFTGVGLDQVLSSSGITKTTFYNYFASKDDLVRAAIEARCLAIQQFLRERSAAPAASPRDRLIGILEGLHEYCGPSSGERCLQLTAAFEFPSPQDPTHQLMKRFRSERAAFIRQAAVEAGIRAADAFTTQYVMVIDGLFFARQVDSDPEATQKAIQAVQALIDAHLPSS